MRACDLTEVRKRWEVYNLPKYMGGRSFLDVGCWGGGFCIDAIHRGCIKSVGVDAVRSPTIDEFERYSDKFTFLQMDIYSPHFLSLPRFDVVLCAGVIYHVPDIVGALQRLRAVLKDGGKLFLETAVVEGETTSLTFCRGASFDDNQSNWFVPTPTTVFELYQELGFSHLDSFVLSPGRALWVLTVADRMPTKVRPRRKEYMTK